MHTNQAQDTQAIIAHRCAQLLLDFANSTETKKIFQVFKIIKMNLI